MRRKGSDADANRGASHTHGHNGALADAFSTPPAHGDGSANSYTLSSPDTNGFA